MKSISYLKFYSALMGKSPNSKTRKSAGLTASSLFKSIFPKYFTSYDRVVLPVFKSYSIVGTRTLNYAG